MKYDEFVGTLQQHARLASRGEAVAAIRATLQTLSERLAGGEPKDLASQLPQEVGIYLLNALEGGGERMDVAEFLCRVSLREGVDLPKATFHTRAVFSLLQKAVSPGEMNHIRAQLPPEFHELFPAEGSSADSPAGISCARPIREIETANPEVTRPDSSLMEAARRMRELDVGALPVCEGQRLIGMVTDRDITIRGTAAGCDPRNTPVRDIMTQEVICCFEDQEVQDAARVMEERQIRRLPILDQNHRLVGMVSLGDLALRTTDGLLVAEVLERVSEHHGLPG